MRPIGLNGDSVYGERRIIPVYLRKVTRGPSCVFFPVLGAFLGMLLPGVGLALFSPPTLQMGHLPPVDPDY